MLSFPPCLKPNCTVKLSAEQYQFSEFEAGAKLFQQRVLTSCRGSKKEMTLNFDRLTPDEFCLLLDFWRSVKGQYAKFDIPERHPLWCNIAPQKKCFVDFTRDRWRFISELDVTPVSEWRNDVWSGVMVVQSQYLITR